MQATWIWCIAWIIATEPSYWPSTSQIFAIWITSRPIPPSSAGTYAERSSSPFSASIASAGKRAIAIDVARHRQDDVAADLVNESEQAAELGIPDVGFARQRHMELLQDSACWHRPGGESAQSRWTASTIDSMLPKVLRLSMLSGNSMSNCSSSASIRADGRQGGQAHVVQIGGGLELLGGHGEAGVLREDETNSFLRPSVIQITRVSRKPDCGTGAWPCRDGSRNAREVTSEPAASSVVVEGSPKAVMSTASHARAN